MSWQSIASWGRENNIKLKSYYYYYWFRKIREAACRTLGSTNSNNKIVPLEVETFTAPSKNIISGSPRGAEASAIVYSIIETAKANNLETCIYLLFILNNLHEVQFETHPDFL